MGDDSTQTNISRQNSIKTKTCCLYVTSLHNNYRRGEDNDDEKLNKVGFACTRESLLIKVILVFGNNCFLIESMCSRKEGRLTKCRNVGEIVELKGERMVIIT